MEKSIENGRSTCLVHAYYSQHGRTNEKDISIVVHSRDGDLDLIEKPDPNPTLRPTKSGESDIKAGMFQHRTKP